MSCFYLSIDSSSWGGKIVGFLGKIIIY